MSIQARRVFLLARMLTAATGIICAVGHVLLVAWMTLTPDDDAPWDDWVSDARLWLAILAFWAAVMWISRKPLRLDT